MVCFLRCCVVVVAVLSLGAGCKPREQAQQRVMLTGSSTIAPLMAELGKRFEAQQPGVRVEVQTGGSSRGVADAMRGTVELGMVSRSLKPEEAKALHAVTVAQDGIAMIVHRDNPIEGLSYAQVQQVYRGELKRWGDVGGEDAPITVVNKAEGRSTLELFSQHFALPVAQIKAMIVIGDNQQGIKTVAADPNAIGYVSIGSAQYEAEHGAAIKLIAVDGQQPTLEALAAGKLKLSRPLNLVYGGEPSALVKAFIAFAQDPKNHDLIKAQYFVPQPL